MKKIRWGIVGPGCIANKFAVAVKNVECAELVAVASRSEENAKTFADKYDIKNVFVGYEEMAESDAVDAVYVATPHPFHLPCAELFLKAGKHVLCEKPLCVNASQAKQLMECAKKNNVFLMEAMWTRFLPAVSELQRVVKRGDIGDVQGVEADFCYSIEPEEDPKVFRNEMAGGSLLDVGVYCLHFVSLFLGSEPVTISALANTEKGVDVHTNVLLKYKNGAIARISSAIGVKKPETACIYGTKGQIDIPSFYGATEFFVSTDEDIKHVVKESIGDGFEEEIIEACRCIQSGKTVSDILPPEESVKILEQMDEIRKQIGVSYRCDE